MNISHGETQYLDVYLVPLRVNNAASIGVSISFYDITEPKRLQQQLEQTNHELETAMEELQSTNEELETTNEELQSTIEELETTNEELQSTNEELETMNEELQSTNEELETLNDELNQRTNDINKSNAFLEAIMAAMHGSVMVLDNDLNLQVWNRLKRPLRGLLNRESKSIEMQLEAVNRRGRTIMCDVTGNPLLIDNEVKGVIIIFEQRGGVFEEKGNSETGEKHG